MRPARILLLVVALVAGGLAAFLATRGTPPQTQQVTKIEKEARVQVLVASKPIGIGERLGSETLKWQDWPEGAIQPGYVTIKDSPDAIEKLTNAVARFEIFAGEPVREIKLAHADQGYLSAIIEPGMRAVSINVTAASSAGGFVIPNDRVDVVLTRRTNNAQESETILRNVKVLAIGQRLGEIGPASGNDGEAADPKSQTFEKATIATLELDPAQAELLVDATQAGTLALVLRSMADFNGAAEAIPGANSNSTIRMVRYGHTQNIIAGADNGPAPVTATPAAYGAGTGDDEGSITRQEGSDSSVAPGDAAPDQDQSQ